MSRKCSSIHFVVNLFIGISKSGKHAIHFAFSRCKSWSMFSYLLWKLVVQYHQVNLANGYNYALMPFVPIFTFKISTKRKTTFSVESNNPQKIWRNLQTRSQENTPTMFQLFTTVASVCSLSILLLSQKHVTLTKFGKLSSITALHKR